jgi:CheY-like chemotaxis protein
MSDYLKFLRQRESSASAKTVLLVDDSPEMRQVLRTFLARDASFKVCGEAGDGAEAIKKAEALTPDLVLLDFLMPGMNGIDVANVLKQLLPKTKIAIFSNYTHDFGTRLSSTVGIDAVIAKGSLAGMAKSLKKLIGRKDAVLWPPPLGVRLRPFRIYKVQSDGNPHFVEETQTLDAAKERVRELGKHWPGKYVIQNEEPRERVFVSTRDETKN